MGPLPTKENARDLLSWEQTFALYLLSSKCKDLHFYDNFSKSKILFSRTDFLFAQAMGYTGEQIPDSDGVVIAEGFVEYSYLDGRVKHFKDVGGTHGSTFGNANTMAVLEEVILGRAK